MSTEIIDEIWKPVEGYESYHVSCIGNVKNVKTGKMRKLSENAKGYVTIQIVSKSGSRKNVYVHRLVATAFTPNIDNLSEVDHIDRVRNNNNISNLRWASRQDQCNNRSKPTNPRRCRSIWMLDKITGEKLRLFKSTKLAAEYIDFSRSKNILQYIWAAGRGKRSSYGDFKWCYVEDEVIEDETWVQVHTGMGNKPIGYQISDHGRLKAPNGLIRVPYENGSVYPEQWIIDNSYRAHRLVALSFLEKPDGKDIVNHIDGNKSNCRLSNLEWVTAAENSRHAVDTGLIETYPVYQYTLSGEFVKKHQNAPSASRELGLAQKSIYDAFKRGYTAGGFQWKLDNGGSDSPIPPVQDARFKNYISQYTLDGEFVKEYSSATDAAREHGVSFVSILYASKKSGLTCAKYQWRKKNSRIPVEDIDKKNHISQYTLDGEFVREFPNAKVAAKHMGVGNSCILKASKKPGKTCANYQWRKTRSDFPVENLLPSRKRKWS